MAKNKRSHEIEPEDFDSRDSLPKDFTPESRKGETKIKKTPDFIACIQLIRPLNCLMAAFATYIGMNLAGLGIYPTIVSAYALAAVFLICAGGMAINDYFDFEIDKINRPKRPLPSGKVSRKSALLFSIALFIIGTGLSYLIGNYALFIAAFASLLLIAYAWKLKKIMLIGHVAVSLLVALTFIFGASINMNYTGVMLLSVLAFFSNMGREIFKSINDIMGDKKMGVDSLPVKFGVIKAKLIATVFILIAIIFSFVPFLLKTFGTVYLFFVVIADMIFLLSIALPLKLSEKLCKLAMMIALIAFLVGAVA